MLAPRAPRDIPHFPLTGCSIAESLKNEKVSLQIIGYRLALASLISAIWLLN